MNVFKIVVGVILILISIFTFLEMYPDYYGAGLWGVATGTGIIFLIGLALILNANYQYKRIEELKSKNFLTNKKVESLKDLLNSSLISKQEFEDKSILLRDQEIDLQIQNSAEYKNLKKFADSKVLTEDEFQEKVKILKNKSKKEYELIENKISSINFTKKVYDVRVGRHLQLKIDFKNGKSTYYYKKEKGNKNFIYEKSGDILMFQSEIQCQRYLCEKYC